MTDIGQRMKENYERPSKHFLTRRVPVVIRVDGKAFHSFTKGLERPFSIDLQYAMEQGAQEAINQMQGFLCAYIQSDEVSFVLTDTSSLEAQPWFGYNQSKVETIAASAMTAGFNQSFVHENDAQAMFDARAFNMPFDDLPNYLLWRMKDWERNSLFMYCSSFFSHKELHGKNKQDKHDMLYSIGKNWVTDVPARFKNGAFIKRSGEVIYDWNRDYESLKEMLTTNGL